MATGSNPQPSTEVAADPRLPALVDAFKAQLTVEAKQWSVGEPFDIKAEKAKAAEQRKAMVVILQNRVASLDRELSDKLNALMHDDKFVALEASWRGLHELVQNTETGPGLKLRLLNAKKDELRADLEKAVDKDQSQLFKKVYEAEYGTYGGNPYSVLIGAYFFNRMDIQLLRDISGVAAGAHVPFVGAADPGLFGLDSFDKLGVPRDLSKIFESTEMIPWNSFRESEDSRYVALTLPRYLIRVPYGERTRPAQSFDFSEGKWEAGVERQADHYLWGNTAYLLAQRITDAHAKYGWCAAIRGVLGGGKVEALQVHTFKTAAGETAMTCPTEVQITDRREKELSDLGFIALVHKKGDDCAAFFGGQTTNKPKRFSGKFKDQADANARLSSQLPVMLAASRFAHYIKVNMRDRIGSFLTRDNVEAYLNNWIADYVLVNDEAPQSVKAQYPLREARVDVKDVPGKPGAYTATVYLRPHFQLEELTASVRVVAKLPAPAAA